MIQKISLISFKSTQKINNIVKNDFYIGEDFKSIIITGSNAGGKTVVLKTVALIIAMTKAGLESSNLIVGIDFTASNEETGKRTYRGKCLHDISDPNDPNPYMKVMDIIFIIFKALNFENFEAQISLRDPNNKEKYIGSDEVWDKAESAIIEACEYKGLKAKVELGEAAFYGPKLDFMVKDAIGRRWQLGTIQVDYNLPERFDLVYTGADNQKHRPVMIHRAPFGSMERFVAVLIEHTGGKFPLWLTPDQAVVLPISEKFNDYAKEVADKLAQFDVRAIVDDRNEKIGRKIRDNELKRIPYLLIVGENEMNEGKISVRKQGEGDQGVMTPDEFATLVNDKIKEMMSEF